MGVLRDTSSSLADRDDALGKIDDQIYHQRTAWDATCIAVPHLIEVFDQQAPAHQIFISILVGLISLERGPLPESLHETEIASFNASLKRAEKQAVTLLQQKFSDGYGVLQLLVAIAGLSGDRELGWRLDQGLEEDQQECNSCSEKFLSCGLMVLATDSINPDEYLHVNKDHDPCYATPIARFVNGVKVRPRSDFPPGSTAGHLVQLCENHGHPRCAQWLRNFFGYTNCPKCGVENDLL